MKLILNITLCIICCGCIQYRNVTNDPTFHTDYVAGGTYRLKQDAVMLKDPDEPDGERPCWWVCAPGRSAAAHIERASEVTDHPEKWRGWVIVPSGTLIQFRLLRLEKSVDMYYVGVYGTFISGPYVGQRVRFNDISQTDSEKFVMIDSSWLELLSK